jgi:hypothetical protein
LPSCLGQYVMICATSLWSKRSKSLASLGDEPGPNNGGLHLYIAWNTRRFSSRYTNWRWLHFMVMGPLLLFVTRRSALPASEESELELSGGTSPGSCTLSSLFLVNVWRMSLPWLTCWHSIGSLYTLSKSKPGAESQS